MAKEKKDKDVLARLADRGEEALNKLADLPGGTKALKALNDLRSASTNSARRCAGSTTSRRGSESSRRSSQR